MKRFFVFVVVLCWGPTLFSASFQIKNHTSLPVYYRMLLPTGLWYGECQILESGKAKSIHTPNLPTGVTFFLCAGWNKPDLDLVEEYRGALFLLRNDEMFPVQVEFVRTVVTEVPMMVLNEVIAFSELWNLYRSIFEAIKNEEKYFSTYDYLKRCREGFKKTLTLKKYANLASTIEYFIKSIDGYSDAAKILSNFFDEEKMLKNSLDCFATGEQVSSDLILLARVGILFSQLQYLLCMESDNEASGDDLVEAFIVGGLWMSTGMISELLQVARRKPVYLRTLSSDSIASRVALRRRNSTSPKVISVFAS